MPIPKPKQNETRREFVQRCMNDLVMINEYKDANQRLAVCSTQFKNKQQKVFLFINICLYLYYINTKTNKMNPKKFYRSHLEYQIMRSYIYVYDMKVIEQKQTK